MKRTLFLIATIVLSSIATVNAQDYKICSIKAYMFYNAEKAYSKGDSIYAGTFSDNLIDNPNISLWNVIIGEGSAKGKSNQTLIVTEVGLTSDVLPLYRITLKLEVFGNDKCIFSAEQDLMFFENKNYHHAFMLNDTGCSTLTIKATLLDSRSRKTMTLLEKKVEYGCGE